MARSHPTHEAWHGKRTRATFGLLAGRLIPLLAGPFSQPTASAPGLGAGLIMGLTIKGRAEPGAMALADPRAKQAERRMQIFEFMHGRVPPRLPADLGLHTWSVFLVFSH